MQYIVRCSDGTRWKVRAAVSLKHAVMEIAHARATGSVGSASFMAPINEPEYVLADVVQINSDNSERKPYSRTY